MTNLIFLEVGLFSLIDWVITAICDHGPMVYTAPYVALLMRANLLREPGGGGWTLEIETFFVPYEMG